MVKTIKNCLTLRANILHKIRDFFAARKILEVETPLLLSSTNPSPYLNSFNCSEKYLQTSPEFAMKKLLAADSGEIYQICKAFRQEEIGRLHNTEFTILEWYRLNFDHHQLMDEVEEFLTDIIGTPQAERHTYQAVCEQFLHLNPHNTNIDQLKACAINNNLSVTNLEPDCEPWLQLLFTHIVEPKLSQQQPTFVYDFPTSQAMLARINQIPYPVAARFEVYYQGIELANGFHELNDPQEQRKRFENDLAKRQVLNLPTMAIDQELLTNLHQLPNCAGVAVGIDRLIMVAAQAKSLDEVLYFRN